MLIYEESISGRSKEKTLLGRTKGRDFWQESGYLNVQFLGIPLRFSV